MADLSPGLGLELPIPEDNIDSGVFYRNFSKLDISPTYVGTDHWRGSIGFSDRHNYFSKSYSEHTTGIRTSNGSIDEAIDEITKNITPISFTLIANDWEGFHYSIPRHILSSLVGKTMEMGCVTYDPSELIDVYLVIRIIKSDDSNDWIFPIITGSTTSKILDSVTYCNEITITSDMSEIWFYPISNSHRNIPLGFNANIGGVYCFDINEFPDRRSSDEDEKPKYLNVNRFKSDITPPIAEGEPNSIALFDNGEIWSYDYLGNGIKMSSSTVVSYKEQSLSETDKAQARQNIGAIGNIVGEEYSNVEDPINILGSIYTGKSSIKFSVGESDYAIGWIGVAGRPYHKDRWGKEHPLAYESELPLNEEYYFNPSVTGCTFNNSIYIRKYGNVVTLHYFGTAKPSASNTAYTLNQILPEQFIPKYTTYCSSMAVNSGYQGMQRWTIYGRNATTNLQGKINFMSSTAVLQEAGFTATWIVDPLEIG